MASFDAVHLMTAWLSEGFGTMTKSEVTALPKTIWGSEVNSSLPERELKYLISTIIVLLQLVIGHTANLFL